jgi:hypothetical protein
MQLGIVEVHALSRKRKRSSDDLQIPYLKLLDWFCDFALANLQVATTCKLIPSAHIRTQARCCIELEPRLYAELCRSQDTYGLKNEPNCPIAAALFGQWDYWADSGDVGGPAAGSSVGVRATMACPAAALKPMLKTTIQNRPPRDWAAETARRSARVIHKLSQRKMP